MGQGHILYPEKAVWREGRLDLCPLSQEDISSFSTCPCGSLGTMHQTLNSKKQLFGQPAPQLPSSPTKIEAFWVIGVEGQGDRDSWHQPLSIPGPPLLPLRPRKVQIAIPWTKIR